MSVASIPWVDGLTIGAMLRQTAQRFPDRDAVVFPGLDREGNLRVARSVETPPASDTHDCYRLNYAALDEEVDRVACALLALGIGKGQHVAVWATNWPQWVLLQFATARIGAVLVTINPAYQSSELAYVLRQSDATALFLINHFRRSDYFAILSEIIPQLTDSEPGKWQAAEFPKLKHVVAMNGTPTKGMSSWSDFLSGATSIDPDRLAARERELQPTDAINIQYTSGTTGFPKGATLTHRNILLNAFYVGNCQKFSEQDRVCVPVPFYHCFGCVLGVLCCATYGAALIVPAEYFCPASTLKAIESERATAIYGVPTMFISQLEDGSFAARDLSSLRTGIMAGSPCPIEVMQHVVSEMGAREITIAYGLTEASPVITQTRTDDPLELRVKTVGRPIPEIEVRIVDPLTGAVLNDNEQGELCVRGHVVMQGYYNMPEQTAAAIDDDGWLHSGDLAVRMPNGYYRITGRIKDMICRGGENIYPREIEEFLYTHPAVQDVAVVGVPDSRFVEETAAWVQLKEGASVTDQDLREYCKQRLARYKVPRYIRIVDHFPQTVTGKIQKFKIRETMIQELGLQQTETA